MWPVALYFTCRKGWASRVTNSACAVSGEGEPCHVRVLFDGGIHRSFIASAAQRAQLPIIRQEWLDINTFGQPSRDTCLRDGVEVKLSPEGKTESYKDSSLRTVRNIQHQEW